jgi:ATP-dependent RNA helicase RhlE
MKFTELNLNNALFNALSDQGLETATPIQCESFAPIMAGKDVVGIAKTGSGKTLAYLIPLIRMWQFSKSKHPSIIIIVPTRELVLQVCSEFQKMAKYTSIKVVGAFGGVNIKVQMSEINEGADAVVATPGRMRDLILNRTVPASFIKKVVIDEVDEMLKLGFRSDLELLMDLLPEKRQTLMFSATLGEDVELLTKNRTLAPAFIEADQSGKTADNLQQYCIDVPNMNTKINLVAHWLRNDKSMHRVLIFVHNKRMADYAEKQLSFIFPDDVAVIHANKNINRRIHTIDDFAQGNCRALITSDLLSRGIDVADITHVINLDVPQQPESYIHRIGRTARSGKHGTAITLISPQETTLWEDVIEKLDPAVSRIDFPEQVEISSQLLPEEENKVSNKIIQIKKSRDPEKGAAFHEKKDKNKKVPIKMTREDKTRIRLGKLYGTKHGGLGKKGKKK